MSLILSVDTPCGLQHSTHRHFSPRGKKQVRNEEAAAGVHGMQAKRPASLMLAGNHQITIVIMPPVSPKAGRVWSRRGRRPPLAHALDRTDWKARPCDLLISSAQTCQ
jgi:hypothetical protein